VSDPWPWPADSPTDRARRVAQSYREALRMHCPELCARIDDRMVSVGQTWVRPRVDRYHVNDLLTAHEAAEYCDVKTDTIYQWKRRGLKVTETVDGDRFQPAHLLDYQAGLRRKRLRGCA